MKEIFKYTMAPMLVAAAFSLAACDTDVEPVDINEPGIAGQNPDLYASYLANLRAYKASNHKVVFGWFDNSAKRPASQGQTISAVPDSLDYLVVTNPDSLTGQEMYQVRNLKEQKAISTLYEISFTTIREAYDAEKQAFDEDTTENKGTFQGFNSYLVGKMQDLLAYCQKYDFDGIVFSFTALTKIYMTEEEKTEWLGYENDFLGIAKDWAGRNAGRTLVLSGRPQNVVDLEVLELAKYIIVPCETSTNEGTVTYNMVKASVEGVPTEKLLPMVQLYSLDETDVKTGFWGTQYAAIGAAKWVASDHEGLAPTAGLALRDIGNDYYHASFVYPTVRQAISIINPTVKE